ncbi:hypothetical protein EDE04_2075 [Streptomyces sp. 2132.2]|uniref:hypothetical protein n=1 Tax=Streptomyces TaxID=1883 RepID=UPI000C6461E6|nr:hypothetical protein [Streptomyces sp. 2132.2]ROQ95624.1 hypothetical protein EDE04_2075 [Streptomyces sp. 2132.2]
MFEYEMATARHADLVREAARYRRLQEAKKARRASSRSQEPERRVTGERSRFTRAA